MIKNFNYAEEYLSIKNIQISKSYFINGLIKTNISWNKINNNQIKQYEIYWIENKCSSDILSCCYRRDAVTIKNSFQLYDLRFNCTYLVNIQAISYKKIKSIQFYFNVSSCELIDVYGTIQPPCQNDRKTSKEKKRRIINYLILFFFFCSSFFVVDMFSSLSTLDLIVTNNGTGLNLFWQNIYSFGKELFFYFN